jgi:hypothetical protein
MLASTVQFSSNGRPRRLPRPPTPNPTPPSGEEACGRFDRTDDPCPRPPTTRGRLPQDPTVCSRPPTEGGNPVPPRCKQRAY